MKSIKIDKKLDGAETAREHHPKLNNSKRFFNLALSPNNINIKSLNLGNINARPLSKNNPKGNSSDNLIVETLKKRQKQGSTNNLNNSINQKNKSFKNLELKEKDINNFKDFKIKDNELLSNKELMNNKIQSILFKNINNINNNLLLKNMQNALNNKDNYILKISNNNNDINKIDLTSIKDLKNKPLIVKIDPKRSTSYLNGKKINEKIKKSTSKKKNASKIIEEEEAKRIKTPTKRIYIKSDRDKMKESLSEFININKNFIEVKGNTTTKIKNNYKDNHFEKTAPEENHFKAVLYSQEIKSLHSALE